MNFMVGTGCVGCVGMIIAIMQMPSWTDWLPRLGALGVGLLLAASVVFWMLRWPASEGTAALPVVAASEEAPVPNASAVARLLGAPAAATQAADVPDASSRFRLTGIVGQGAGQGVALLSVDGKPAKPYRQGSVVEEGWLLRSVQQRSIALAADASGPVRLTLELPPR